VVLRGSPQVIEKRNYILLLPGIELIFAGRPAPSLIVTETEIFQFRHMQSARPSVDTRRNVFEAGWAPEPVWTLWSRKLVLQPVARRYTD
jgi:hypothetical protein